MINNGFYNYQENKYVIITMGIYVKDLGSVSCIMIWESIHIMIYP